MTKTDKENDKKDKDKVLKVLPDRSEKKLKKTLEVELTIDELLKRAEEVADLQKDLHTIEADFASVRARYKGKIGETNLKFSRLLDAIRTKREERLVDCTEVKDYKSNKVFYLFEKKEYSDRALTSEERQMELEGMNKKDGARRVYPRKGGESVIGKKQEFTRPGFQTPQTNGDGR